MYDKSLDSRDYDLKQIQEEPRLSACRREFLVLFGIISITSLIVILITFAVDWGTPDTYSYLFGQPLWVTLCAIVSALGTVACILYVVKGIQNTPLDDDDKKER